MNTPLQVCRVIERYMNSTQPLQVDYARVDCARFAAWCVRELGGGDYLHSLSYCGMGAAARRIREAGGLEQAVSSALARHQVDAALLEPGDVVHWRIRGFEGLGIALHPGAVSFAVLLEQGRIAELGASHAVGGWRMFYPRPGGSS